MKERTCTSDKFRIDLTCHFAIGSSRERVLVTSPMLVLHFISVAVGRGSGGGARAPFVVSGATSRSTCSSPRMLARMTLSDQPGNYVAPYSSALGVSTAAILCSELICLPGAASTALAGRAAACTSLPLICCAFHILRTAAMSGPVLLRQPQQQRLNIGLALSSLVAVLPVFAPLPVMPVVIARGGSALLCFEVWSKGLVGGKAGDPFAEVIGVVREVVAAMLRAVELLTKGGAPAVFSMVALGHCGLIGAAMAAPAATAAAWWPAAAPGLGGARVAASTALLSACSAVLLGDVAANRQAGGTGDELRPWRWLNRALLLSSAAHVAVQCAALAASRGGVGLAPLAIASRAMVLATIAAQALVLGTAVLCATQDALFFK